MPDLDNVAQWMSEHNLGGGPLENVSEITGGTQNIMLRFERAGREYVLRRGPKHLRPVTNRVLLRETRVLAALAGTDVPHPRLIAACPDPEVLGDSVFYLMEPLDGFNAGAALPPLHAGDATIRYAMGLSIADALAKLGAVDYSAVGLADYGKPDGFLERQVPRWLAELASYDDLANYAGPQIGDIAGVAAWLTENRPTTWQPGIMHGDYHAANVMFSYRGPEVIAIVDWEMSTIGDPLLDLGWLLATWSVPGRPSVLGHALTDAGGVPDADEMVAQYARNSNRDLSHINWYAALACFRYSIILEGTYARACAGLAPAETGALLHTAAVLLMERAEHFINS